MLKTLQVLMSLEVMVLRIIQKEEVKETQRYTLYNEHVKVSILENNKKGTKSIYGCQIIVTVGRRI
jgi:hypothetical protein